MLGVVFKKLVMSVLVLQSLTACIDRGLPQIEGDNQGSSRRTPPPTSSPVPSPWVSPQPQPQPSPYVSPYIEPAPISPTCLGPDASPAVCEAEQVIFVRTNEYRASAKTLFGSPRPVPALRLDGQLSAVARRWSKEQAKEGTISHKGFQEGQRDQFFREIFPGAAMNFKMSLENVAWFSGSRSPTATGDQFSTQWRKSWGHYRNMVNGNAKIIGVGVYRDPNGGGTYATQIFGQ